MATHRLRGWAAVGTVLAMVLSLGTTASVARLNGLAAPQAGNTASEIRIQLDTAETYALLTPGTILQFEVFGTGYDSFAYALDGGPLIDLPLGGWGTTWDDQVVQFYFLDSASWPEGMRVVEVAALYGGEALASQTYVFFADLSLSTPLDTFDVVVVLIGFDDVAADLALRLPAHRGASTRLTSDPATEGFIDIRYDYQVQIASPDYYRQFLMDAREAGSYRDDVEGRLNLEALELQRNTGVPQDIFDPLVGYEIPSSWLEAYLGSHPVGPLPDPTDSVYYLVNLAPLDAESGLDHWYTRSNPDIDTEREQDWWRLEWDNDLNTPMGYPLSIFGGPDHRVFIDPTAYEWYLDWTWIWWEGGTGSAPYSPEYEVVAPEARADYLAETVVDLLGGLSSDLPWMPPEESRVSIRNLVLVDSATTDPAELGWAVHETSYLEYLREFMSLKTWEMDTTFADVSAFPDLSTYVDSVTTWDAGMGSVDGLSVWSWLFDHKADFVGDDPASFEILSVSFVYDDRAMTYAGNRFTGLGGSGISAIFLQTDRLFDTEGAPQKGLTDLIAHEAGHSLATDTSLDSSTTLISWTAAWGISMTAFPTGRSGRMRCGGPTSMRSCLSFEACSRRSRQQT